MLTQKDKKIDLCTVGHVICDCVTNTDCANNSSQKWLWSDDIEDFEYNQNIFSYFGPWSFWHLNVRVLVMEFGKNGTSLSNSQGLFLFYWGSLDFYTGTVSLKPKLIISLWKEIHEDTLWKREEWPVSQWELCLSQKWKTPHLSINYN